MYIEDPFGNRKEYTPEKIIDSVTRAGFSEGTAEEIEENVRERVESGMQSEDLYRIVYEEMEAFNEAYALRYRLREAIGVLDPNYHEFEKYMCQVLAQDGINTEWSPRPLPQGACSEHEIDIIGRTDGTTYAIECKHHFHYHRLTGMDVAMIQFAALDDLKEGYEQGVEHAIDVDQSWVIVNTKLSEHAKNYAECKGIRMTAWNYPEDNSLREIVERNSAYPMTILRPEEDEKEALSKQNILTLQQLLDLDEDTMEALTLSKDHIQDLQQQAQELLDGDSRPQE